MFQFPALASFRMTCLQHAGLSHSDIFGSTLVCSSPKLFAAYHVLLRLLVPRHPPYALICFNLLKRFFYYFNSTTLLNCLTQYVKELRGLHYLSYEKQQGNPSCRCYGLEPRRRPVYRYILSYLTRLYSPKWWRISESNR